MIQRLVARALQTRMLVILLAFGVSLGGLAAFKALDVEAYPLPTPPLIEVITQPPGWSAEEVERYVTVPVEVGLSGMPGLDHVRSQSIFGLSDVKCYFKWGTTYEVARQEVINRLQFISLPPGIQPGLSPWNAIGEIFRYRLVGKGYTLFELKAAEDWILEKMWKQVPGVIDVTSYGGETKQFHVNVDPTKLHGYGVTLQQLTNAISNANQNVGGERLFVGEQSFDIRGIGLIKNSHDIEKIVVSEQHGTPVRVADVATVEVGHAPRLGIVGMADDTTTPSGSLVHEEDTDMVQGIVLMRYGGETQPTLEGVYDKVKEIERNHLLPPGMKIEPYYDRGALVHLTTHTVLHNMVEGMVLVTLVLFLFLGNVRAALVTAINIPIALLIAFCGMKLTDTPANLISLGAVDFGIVVDSTVIMMENVFRHLGDHGKGTMRQRILAGAAEVGGPMAFSTVIIGVAFLPLFTMTGAEGVIFSPMARTYAFAIGGAILLAISVTPVVISVVLPPSLEEKELFLMRGLRRIYNPLFSLGLRHPIAGSLIALAPIAACVVMVPFLGREFMPKLEEGNFWVRATFPTSISLTQTAQYVPKIRNIMLGCPTEPNQKCDPATRKHPEVERVVSQLGRPDDGTDLAGFNNLELFAPLKPFDEWPKGLTKDKLTDEITQELQKEFPGVNFNFSQYISDNVEEAVSGVKGENSIKVVGNDLAMNDQKAAEIMAAMSKVDGVKDLGTFPSVGQPDVKITIDRVACERAGLNTGDVNSVIQAALGGAVLTQVYEGEKHFDLTVRWAEPFRASLDAIRHITVPTPDGNTVPLGQLAEVAMADGPAVIYREDGYRYTPVKFSVRGRDLASTIADAQKTLKERVKLPYDMHLEWAGQINELNAATGRLAIIIPLTLLLIGILVYAAVGSIWDTIIVFISIPVACTGGVLALLLTGNNFSVSAAMGFVSVFGIAIQGAILVVTYFQRLRAEDHDVVVAAREAAEKRFRPVLMTTLVATLGLTPMALSHGIGADTSKPLAIVVIGGSLFLAFLTQLIQPPLLVLMHRWLESRKPVAPVPAAAT
jgi:cobalt-zinc-cadmium resistance protein CzcA